MLTSHLYRYTRPNQYGPIPYHIDILPLVTDCSFIPGDDLCIALPGCIQCLDFKESIRVLHEDEEENFVSSDLETDPYSHYYRRQLYANILPDLAGISNTKAKGVCHSGWRNKDCPTFVYDAGISYSRICSYDRYIVFSLIVLCFLIFI